MERYANMTREAIFGMFKKGQIPPIWERWMTDSVAQKAKRIPDPRQKGPNPLADGRVEYVDAAKLKKQAREINSKFGAKYPLAYMAWLGAWDAKNDRVGKLIHALYRLYIAWDEKSAFRDKMKRGYLGHANPFFYSVVYVAHKMEKRDRKVVEKWLADRGLL